MAAAALMEFCASGTRSEYGWQTTQPSITTARTTLLTLWDEYDLQTRLALIARSWLLKRARNDTQVKQHQRLTPKPLVIPDPTPRRSRQRPSNQREEYPPSSQDPTDHHPTLKLPATERATKKLAVP
ncbi:hypothetical protein F5Y15DRAFT_353258 [Xylariaceae sp. FL0016]|nr:hypothetical protein F5Y15DRAFT_353258 [Xylariaceae sp. FL0016]